MELEQYQLRLTRHAYERYCLRVGRIKYSLLKARCITCLQLGHYRYGERAIRLYGVWWGCVVVGTVITLTTCYGRQKTNMITERSNERERRGTVWRS